MCIQLDDDFDLLPLGGEIRQADHAQQLHVNFGQKNKVQIY
jgi:hypothetical protein